MKLQHPHPFAVSIPCPCLLSITDSLIIPAAAEAELQLWEKAPLGFPCPCTLSLRGAAVSGPHCCFTGTGLPPHQLSTWPAVQTTFLLFKLHFIVGLRLNQLPRFH